MNAGFVDSKTQKEKTKEGLGKLVFYIDQKISKILVGGFKTFPEKASVPK